MVLTDESSVAVGLELGQPGRGEQEALVRVKVSYRVLPDGSCAPAPAVPLGPDPRAPAGEGPRLVPGCDYWPEKGATDVVVHGSAWAPGGVPAPRFEAAVRVGEAEKRLCVFGRRAITWVRGKPRIDEPEPCEKVALGWENAYGGIDWRVPLPGAEDPVEELIVQTDHPGLYPRNPFGKGYVVQRGEVPGLQMPQLEDPDDLLEAGRLVVGAPELWYEQPLPWSLGWQPAIFWPRCVFFAPGVDAWHPCPEDADLAEVRRGLLPVDFRAQMAAREQALGPHPRFFEEASAGLSLGRAAEAAAEGDGEAEAGDRQGEEGSESGERPAAEPPGLRGGEEVSLRGLHPTAEEITFTLPPLPRLTLGLAGDGQSVTPMVQSVELYPEEERFTLLLVTRRALPRVFIPGVHLRIPLWAAVDDNRPVRYQPPVPLRVQLAAAERAQKEG